MSEQSWAMDEVLRHGPYQVKVRAKGQVTIPAPIMRALGWQVGDVLRFEITPDGLLLAREVSNPASGPKDGA